MFEFLPASIQGCYEIQPKTFADSRGKFIKLFHSGVFRDKGLADTFNEVHYSISHKDVLRGLHFHLPPDANALLVSCIRGRVLDVVVDLRKKSSTYHNVHSTELAATKGTMLYIPEGLAHGFLSLEDNSVHLGLRTRESPRHSQWGINWKSIDFNWPVQNALVSEEDQRLIALVDFASPF